MIEANDHVRSVIQTLICSEIDEYFSGDIDVIKNCCDALQSRMMRWRFIPLGQVIYESFTRPNADGELFRLQMTKATDELLLEIFIIKNDQSVEIITEFRCLLIEQVFDQAAFNDAIENLEKEW